LCIGTSDGVWPFGNFASSVAQGRLETSAAGFILSAAKDLGIKGIKGYEGSGIGKEDL
jgi:hypothetical protein